MKIHSIVKRIKALGFTSEAYVLAEVGNEASRTGLEMPAIETKDYATSHLDEIVADLRTEHRGLCASGLDDHAKLISSVMVPLERSTFRRVA